jgi:hypothetical protein
MVTETDALPAGIETIPDGSEAIVGRAGVAAEAGLECADTLGVRSNALTVYV